jgi:cobalamin biosynthesis Mg chelatase CobN
MLRRALTLAVLAGALVVPATAQADAFTDVFADYQKDGRIDPCAHSASELRAAKGKVPSDIEQYAPDFPQALDAAAEDRARSACPSSGAAAGTTTTTGKAAPPADEGAGTPAAEVTAPTSTVPTPPGSAQPAPAAADGAIVNAAARTAERGASEPPAPLIALAVVGGLLLLGLLLWGLARFFAWDPAWLAGTRHAVQEAGWRAGGLWDDFTDWLRPGRRGGAGG